MPQTAQSHALPLATSGAVPAHIAIIMDGNGRWARERGISRVRGHNQGAQALRNLLEACESRQQIKYLTLYAFSTENWKRPADEVSDLMNLLRYYVKREAKVLHEKGVRIRFIGQRDKLDADIRADLEQVEQLMQNNTRLTVAIALSYGARQEIADAMKTIARKVEQGKLKADSIDETLIAQHLYTSELPDPDLLIRTGGDERLSNFLLWQSAYTELYFTDTLWPDFNAEELDKAIECFASRERRFGMRHE
jgi:undecaprenyl diphosphate synthase